MKNITIKLCHFIFLLAISCVAMPSLAAVTKLKLSGPTTAPVGEIVQLSVQAQNDSGEAEKATETIYFTPKSSPSAGEFSPYSTWKSGSFFISKNSANKTFYYRNSSAGEQTIIVENEKGLAVGSIIVDVGGQTTGENETNTADGSDESSSTSSSTPGGFVNLSSHSSQSDLSDYEEDEIKIGAGRPRLASVKTPIEFKVESEGTLSGLLMWSFGDGTSAIGANVWHKYEFPGQYNVVLNFSGEKEAVSRTTATVTEANFSLDVSLAGGYVEIKNLGSQEENINDWTIKNGTTTVFTFAKDTIISSHSDLKVALPKEMLNFNLSLNYPDGEVQARIGNLTSVAQIAELRAKLSEAEKILAEIKGQERIAVWTALPAAQTARAGSNLKVLQPLISSTSQPTLASSSDIIVIKKKEGMIGRILKVFNFF